ncbi:MAG: aminopeptidase P family protein [Rhodospirillales bacterium]|nr:aminopeptidase P family protein [Rhodospirillales bacterium]
MVLGVGGSNFEAELARMTSRAGQAVPITVAEYQARIARAQTLMRAQGIDALYLDTSTNLRYFTGIELRLTERLHGAIIPAQGDITYLSPVFEEPKTRELMRFGTDVQCWEEDEDPTALVIETLRGKGIEAGTVAVDPATPFFTVDGLRKAGNRYSFASASSVTAACRQVKSPAEVALMQIAMDITMEVQRATARCMRAGMSTTEVQGFIDAAHRKLGGVPASRAVQFGEATAYPHGVPYAQTLADGDMVLVDIGCFVEGYRSDITRTYVFGEPTPRQREIWDLELRAQWAGFHAARLGAPCEAVDAGARGEIVAAGFGPGYKVPGLPHRTGHGIGMDVHEESFMVKGNKTPIAAGMCFSVEPMICIYGEFGVRLEDIVTMTEAGPRWFTAPCHSVDDPFAVGA